MNAVFLFIILSFTEFPEPPRDYLVGWNVEELPGKVGLYYDLDGDGKGDLITAHNIIKVERIPKCTRHEFYEKTVTVGFHCDSRMPLVYTINRRIEGVRMIDEKWHIVMEKTFRVCTHKNYEKNTCSKWSDE